MGRLGEVHGYTHFTTRVKRSLAFARYHPLTAPFWDRQEKAKLHTERRGFPTHIPRLLTHTRSSRHVATRQRADMHAMHRRPTATIPWGISDPKTKELERVTGFEPVPSAWKAEVLPLNYTRSTLRTHYAHCATGIHPLLLR
jgi:hypothetical protein